ncbi:MAG: methylated-DNA--[protein]-cysteine S-methyltransferase [Desulfonatronovibrionaceae bacterium]
MIKHDNCRNFLEPEFFANSFFSLTIWWHDELIRCILLNRPPETGIQTARPRTYSRIIACGMLLYEKSQPFAWPLPPLEWSSVSEFSRDILSTLLLTTGFGRTTTYGTLACMAGHPGAARAVGRTMASNPWPVLIPCHRVLAAGNRLGGFSSGLELKKTLLTLEGLSSL